MYNIEISTTANNFADLLSCIKSKTKETHGKLTFRMRESSQIKVIRLSYIATG